MNISRPTLILDKEKAITNIRTMQTKAMNLGLSLRPHFKTHQSLAIGRWFKAAGVDQIAVSSVRMAQYFADEWDDITIAFPTNVLELDAINQLASKIRLNLTVYNVEVLHMLGAALLHPVSIFLKINIGNNRAGLHPSQQEEIIQFGQVVQSYSQLTFKGVLMHAGHSYSARSQEAILDIHQRCMQHVEWLHRCLDQDFPDLIFSYGDTPTCSVAKAFPGIHELRPGNFVFYDMAQVQIGSCTVDQVAVALASPVVGKQADDQTVILYGGGIHLSKDRITIEDGQRNFGRMVRFTSTGWDVLPPHCYLKSISQEHGVAVLDNEVFKTIEVGDILGILPVHSCMTADLMKSYQTDEKEIIQMMK